MKVSQKEREALLLDNQKLIHYFLQRRGFSPSHPDYEDLLQECNLRCWRALQEFDPEKGALSTYLAKVCFNTIGLYLRRKRRRPKPKIYLDAEVGPWCEYQGNAQVFNHETIANPNTEADFLEARILSTLSLSNLDLRLKIVFFLAYLGYTQQESAEVIGVSQAQVSRLLSKARREIEGGVA
jgi:RNA polymerase sigma-70 factor (ECF subfamily)